MKIIQSSFLPDPSELGTFTAISEKYIRRLIMVFVRILLLTLLARNPTL